MMQPGPDARVLEAIARSRSESSADGSGAAAPPPRISAARLGTAFAWLLDVKGRALILKRYRQGQDEADVNWEHSFLECLAATGFSASRPVAACAGRSWLRLDDRIWGTLTYLPGRSLAWEREPGLDMAGAWLAEYHDAARSVPVTDQRPSGVPLLMLSDLAPWDRLPAALPTVDHIRHFAHLLDELRQELTAMEFGALERLVIHGDCTTDNMLIGGTPPQMVGLIDFGNAYVEGWLADLGAGLWRAGRAAPDDVGLDARRVAEFVAGYHRRSPLEPHLACAVPLLIKARGLQLIVRWTRRATPDALESLVPVLARTLERTVWISDHQRGLEGAILAMISR